MAELQPPEAIVNAGPAGVAIAPAVPAAVENLSTSLAPKRQRRPSVRLGEIGDQPAATLSYDSQARRVKPWRFHKDYGQASKASKTRPLTNLVNGGECHETLETEERSFAGDGNLDSAVFGNRKAKRRGATKRLRSNWATKFDEGAEGDEKFSGREDDEEEYRDFDPEGSESLLKEQSPVHSVDNVALDLWHGHRRPVRARVSESREHDAVELDAMPDSDSRDRKCRTSADRNLTANRLLDDGVRTWLFGLGLGRYAPVFEIHEVDFEVLPLLTLEDLKDMGINAVGSRRKIYNAIQNLRKGFT
ncbi:hypothetical protein AAG906_004239 [Vitis piasezkii]